MKTRLSLIALAVGIWLGAAAVAAEQESAAPAEQESAAPAEQESAAPAEGFGPVPAPPGPYQSGRPYLGGEQGMPYHGAMQFRFREHARPYSGPGRYWAPSDWEQRQQGRLATRPMAPWGAPRGESSEPGPGHESAARQPPMRYRSPTRWQQPTEH